jgi:hypothetical protein
MGNPPYFLFTSTSMVLGPATISFVMSIYAGIGGEPIELTDEPGAKEACREHRRVATMG